MKNCQFSFSPVNYSDSDLRKHGSSVVSAQASGARGSRFNPCGRLGNVLCPTTLLLVSLAGMT